MINIYILKLTIINILLFTTVLCAETPIQTAKKELLSKTTSNGNTIFDRVARYQNNSNRKGTESSEAVNQVLESSISECLKITPQLTCTPAGWILNTNTISPNIFTNQDLDLSVKTPSTATITKVGNTWQLNGVISGDTITLVTNATKIGEGKEEGTDLCCLGEEKITIPQEECVVEAPHVYSGKENKKKEIIKNTPPIISNPIDLDIRKTAPKECKKRGKCTFTFVITNNGSDYLGPISISDISKPFVGQFLYDNSKQWNCLQTKSGYKCTNQNFLLKAKKSFKLKLTTRIPKNAIGFLKNCVRISSPKSNNKSSCVKVKIQNIKKAKPVKIIKPTCPSWQHWDGKRCISCQVNTSWSEKDQECLSTKKTLIVKEKVVDIECGLLQKYNKKTKQCETILDINFGVGFGRSGGSIEDK